MIPKLGIIGLTALLTAGCAASKYNSTVKLNHLPSYGNLTPRWTELNVGGLFEAFDNNNDGFADMRVRYQIVADGVWVDVDYGADGYIDDSGLVPESDRNRLLSSRVNIAINQQAPEFRKWAAPRRKTGN